MTLKVQGNTVVDTTLVYTVNQANVSAGGNVNWSAAVDTYVFQGSVSGYTAGGVPGSNVIDKFPFSSDTNASDVGDLIAVAERTGSASSDAYGYTIGGTQPPFDLARTIQKFSFATDSNASAVGLLSNSFGNQTAGQSSSYNGYASTGYNNALGLSGIDKFPFATDTNAVVMGDGTVARFSASGQSSSEHGYTSGGYQTVPSATFINVIDRFPFSSDTNASDVGDLSRGGSGSAGQSSTTHGYATGGSSPPSAFVSNIEKFIFSASANASDIGDLTDTPWGSAGQSSTASGYSSGGVTPSLSNVIQKFPFSSDTNASDVGDLTQARRSTSGNQARTAS